MSFDSLLLFLHVLGAIVWIGTGTTLCLIGLRVQRSTDQSVMAEFAGTLRYLGLQFVGAWNNLRHTRYQVPDIDVNRVLADRYTTGKPLTFTRRMLWDMEVRKAASPGIFIPYVVRSGSDRSWNRHEGDGGEYLDRCSLQRLWLSPDRYELILERAFLNHDEQRVGFLGVRELTDADGTLLHAGAGQPLFHVEHPVAGDELQPLNRWRIVHLTHAPDERLTAVFERLAASPWLPEHTEIYIRAILGTPLARKSPERAFEGV